MTSQIGSAGVYGQGPCTANNISHVWLNESVDVNNSIKNETFEQRNEFNMCFVLLNLCPVVILDIINIKNRCL
jgi:hypothetical protein